MMFFQFLYCIAFALLAVAQTQASFDGTTLTFSFSGGGSLYDGTSNYRITRVDTTGYGYWVTAETASISGQPSFVGTLGHQDTRLTVVPSTAVPSNSTLSISFQGALIDTPPANGVSHYYTTYVVSFQPVSGGDSVSRSFLSSVDVNWTNYPNAAPLMVADILALQKRSFANQYNAKRYVAETTLATVNAEVGVFTAGSYNATY